MYAFTPEPIDNGGEPLVDTGGGLPGFLRYFDPAPPYTAQIDDPPGSVADPYTVPSYAVPTAVLPITVQLPAPTGPAVPVVQRLPDVVVTATRPATGNPSPPIYTMTAAPAPATSGGVVSAPVLPTAGEAGGVSLTTIGLVGLGALVLFKLLGDR